MSQPILTVENLSHTFRLDGVDTPVLDRISLRVEAGEFVCIVGHSGCGKSTLLRCLAGLLPIEAGQALLNGRPVGLPSPDCGLVFQDPRLLPWLRVRDNVAFGLRALPKAQRRELVEQQLALVGLSPFAAVWPWQLSGGMAQRVALARALAPRPSLLLLDEPLSALDALTRARLQEDLLQIQRQEGLSMVLVTHDIREAVYLGDRVVVLSQGPGSVREILTLPRAETADRTSEAFGTWERTLTALLQDTS